MSYFTTNDNCKLHYEDIGTGKPLILIHGWSQSSNIFRRNVPALCQHYRVISLDLRGHGESAKPSHGYRISRFAKDVYELIQHLDLKDVSLLGWSMGCSVIWSYWDLFYSERLSKLILVDQPGWLLKTEENTVGMLTFNELVKLCGDISSDQKGFTEGFITSALSIKESEKDENYSNEVKNIIDENYKMPAEYASKLAFIHWLNDWRDIIPTINIPTLVVSGKKSIVNWKALELIHKDVSGSKVEYFEGRGHFMFFEESERFNQLVKNFLG